MCIILKIGGALQDDMVPVLYQAIVAIQSTGVPVAVVHGGGPRISLALAKRNITLPFVNGVRMTPPEAMPVVEQVLWSEINFNITEKLCRLGINAIRVNGSNGLFQVASTPQIRSGEIQSVTATTIRSALEALQVPIVAPLGVDGCGLHYNINADSAAARLAVCVGATKVIFCTDVSGIYADFDKGRLLKSGTPALLTQFLQENKFTHGMIPKVTAVLTALAAGVNTAYVVNGRDAKSLLWAVQDNQNHLMAESRTYGTRIQHDAVQMEYTLRKEVSGVEYR